MSGERQGGRETVDRLTKRMRESGMSSDAAKQRAVEAVRKLDKTKR
jgi:hypothetical protein